MMLIDNQGRLLASNDPADQQRVNLPLQDIDLAQLRQLSTAQGETTHLVRQVHFSALMNAEIIDIFAPVIEQGAEILGYVRLSYPVATVTGDVYQLRFLILVVLVIGLLIRSALGTVLAVSVSKPVQEVTQAISALARSTQMKLLNVYGAEEIQSLSQSVNDLVARLRDRPAAGDPCYGCLLPPARDHRRPGADHLCRDDLRAVQIDPGHPGPGRAGQPVYRHLRHPHFLHLVLDNLKFTEHPKWFMADSSQAAASGAKLDIIRGRYLYFAISLVVILIRLFS